MTVGAPFGHEYAVVFSGGGARAAWQAGAIQVLVQLLKREPTAVTGASAGAINAAAYWAGQRGDNLAGWWLGLAREQVLRTRPLWKSRALAFALRGALSGLVKRLANREHSNQASVVAGVRASLDRLPPRYDNQPLRDTLAAVVAQGEPRQATMALGVALSDLASGRPAVRYLAARDVRRPEYERVSTTEDLIEALIGSTAIPAFFAPGSDTLYDGGILRNQPVLIAYRLLRAQHAEGRRIFVLRAPQRRPTGRVGIGSLDRLLLESWLSAHLYAEIPFVETMIRQEITLSGSDRDPSQGRWVFEIDAKTPPSAGLLDFGVDCAELVSAGRRDVRDFWARSEQAILSAGR